MKGVQCYELFRGNSTYESRFLFLHDDNIHAKAGDKDVFELNESCLKWLSCVSEFDRFFAFRIV